MKVQIKDVNKKFAIKDSEVTALEDISINISTNEMAVIVGPSGCGKSTLLNIVAGLEKPSTGTVLMNGKEVIEPGADRGMVFQSYTLFPWLTVQKNVEFGLMLKGVNEEERNQTARKYIELVGLSGFENALPKELSGGMKQRVAIARVLANQPEVLLMDEPFGALDAQTRVVMQELLLKVWEKEKTTVIFITHDIDEAIFLADKVYVMSRRPGRIRNEIPIHLPRPRDHKIMVKPEFAELKENVMELLWEESRQAASE